MVHTKKTFLILMLVAMLAITWLLVLISGPKTRVRQAELMAQAQAYMADGVYVTALPLLEEAANLSPKFSAAVEEQIVVCYLALDDHYAAENRLQGIVDTGRANEALYLRLANLYLPDNKYKEGLALLKAGGEKLNSDVLLKAYQENRFQFKQYYTAYQTLNGSYQGRMAANVQGRWGYVDSSGTTVVPFRFDKATDFDSDTKALVMDDGKAAIVDGVGQRLALCKEQVEDIAPLSGGTGGVKIAGSWYLINHSFNRDETPYEYIGRLSENRRAMKKEGSWYLCNAAQKQVTPEFEDIKLDASGSAFAMGRAFAKREGAYWLVDGAGVPINQEQYEDAHPFYDGAAAVKQQGKWLFINNDGNTALTGEFEDVDSFSCGLAAVRIGAKWGYMDQNGRLMIEPIYEAVRPFHKGVGAVLLGEEWHVIQLREYED